MRPFHVGYVLKMYPRLSETFIVNEILQLERLGARVTIYSLRAAREGRFHEKLSRVKADVIYLDDRTPVDLLRHVARHRERLEGARDVLAEMLWNEITASDSPSVKLVGKAIDVADDAAARGIDHLHAHFATSAADVARGASRLSGIPYSVTAHAKDIYLDAHDPDRLRSRLRDGAFVVTVCDANRAWIDSVAGEGARVRRIYNGLDLEEFAPRDRRPDGTLRILGVGRLVPKKGFDTLVRSCASLARRGVPFDCRIAGDGEEGDALRRLVAGEGMESHVRFLGPLPNERVREEMHAADVMALPCRITDDGNRDALPTVLLEALALELPFVSTPVTGIPEIAGDEEGGLLVPPDDPEALAEALAALHADPERRLALGRAGRGRALALFDGRRSAADLLSLFRGGSDAAAGAAAGAEPCVSST